MTDATITIEDLAGSTKLIKVVHISGQLDESNIDEKIKDVYKLVEANPKGLNLLFDLENLEYMNSKSIGYMTDLYGKITESGGQVVIAKAKPNIVDILQVVGLTQLIKTFDNMLDAQNYLQTTSSASALADNPATPPTQAPAQEITPSPSAPQPTNPTPTQEPPTISQASTPPSA